MTQDQAKSSDEPIWKTYNSRLRELEDLGKLAKDYARQETLGPLRGVGRYIQFGLAGTLAMVVALVFLTLGSIRLVQFEMRVHWRGNWSWVPYGVGLLVAIIAVGASLLAVFRSAKK